MLHSHGYQRVLLEYGQSNHPCNPDFIQNNNWEIAGIAQMSTKLSDMSQDLGNIILGQCTLLDIID